MEDSLAARHLEGGSHSATSEARQAAGPANLVQANFPDNMIQQGNGPDGAASPSLPSRGRQGFVRLLLGFPAPLKHGGRNWGPHQLAEEAKAQSWSAMAIFLDIRKAFGALPHSVTISAVRR